MNSAQVAAVMDEIRGQAGRRRISVKELSRRVGIDYATMRNYLAVPPRGGVMDMSVMYRVAEAMGMTGAELLAAAEANAKAAPGHSAEDHEHAGSPESPLSTLADARVAELSAPDRVESTKRRRKA